MDTWEADTLPSRWGAATGRPRWECAGGLVPAGHVRGGRGSQVAGSVEVFGDHRKDVLSPGVQWEAQWFWLRVPWPSVTCREMLGPPNTQATGGLGIAFI